MASSEGGAGVGHGVPESIRSRAWAIAKPVALAEWQNGSADTTQMLITCSRALDAALDALLARLDAAEKVCRDKEPYHVPLDMTDSCICGRGLTTCDEYRNIVAWRSLREEPAP